jgi:hypothetical protein
VSTRDGSLPVDLTTFTAARSNSAVQLRWKTASEQNNSGFAVEHQSPQAGWTRVGFVEGAGNSQEPQSYQFTVQDLNEPGRHRFRLQQMDYDGTRTRHGPVSVRIGLGKPLQLRPPAPNPTSSHATLQVGVRDKERVTVSLYNELGQRVATLYSDTPPPGELHPVRLDAQNLASGTYFVRARTAEHVQTQRVVIVH